MRYSATQKALLGLMICVASTLAGAQENRFEGWHDGEMFYRFDNQTGEIHKLIKPQSGPAMWVKCDIVEPKPQAQKAPQLPTQPIVQQLQQQPAQAPRSDCIPGQARPQPAILIDPGTMPAINADQIATPTPSGRKIQIFDDFGKNITDEIDDSDREACKGTINGYDGLHVSHTLKTSGDRISGIVIIDNKGNRKIGMLELTMTVRVVGKDKPIEHKRFIFADKPDCEKPPAPSFGSSGMSVLKKVDIPTPSGVINGMPEVRVSFIRFDDRE